MKQKNDIALAEVKVTSWGIKAQWYILGLQWKMIYQILLGCTTPGENIFLI